MRVALLDNPTGYMFKIVHLSNNDTSAAAQNLLYIQPQVSASHAVTVCSCPPFISIPSAIYRCSMGFQAAESLSDQIARHIAEQIITGELVEGERIQELRIARDLDVSRGSVREALLILERSYLIDIFPRRGAVVAEMSVQQIKSLFDVSMLLLGNMVQRTSECWRQADGELMNQLLQKLADQVRAGDIEKFYDQVFVFLQQTHRMIGNAYLADMFENILPALRRSYFLTLNTSKRELQEAFDLFRHVVDAILIRKGDQAADFMYDFCRHLRNLVLDSLARMKQIELAWAQRSRR